LRCPCLSISKSKMHRDAYFEKESSVGSGRDDGASLAGKESAIVLSSIFSRFAFELAGSTTRSSGSLPGLIFEVRFSAAAFLRSIVSYSCVYASTSHSEPARIATSHARVLARRSGQSVHEDALWAAQARRAISKAVIQTSFTEESDWRSAPLVGRWRRSARNRSM
jgi:hypothetical protein